MGTISVSLPSDGTTADVSDYNTPINTIVAVINGNLDNSNISGLSGTKITGGTLPGTALDSTLSSGWLNLNNTPSSVTYSGNGSYSLVFNSVDLTSTLSTGMRLRTTRSVAAPTQCTSLNGSTQYYSKSSPAGMTFTNNWTCMGWIKPTSYPPSVSFIQSNYNGTQGWNFRFEATGQIAIQGQTASVNELATTYQSIPLNKWTHVAATMDMSGNVANFYINGILVPSVYATPAAGTSMLQGTSYQIGASNGSGFFPGKIAQAAVFSSVLSQATIQSYVSQGLVGTESTLVSAYSFNNSINDLNANANNLTANGSAVATNADSPFGTQASSLISSTLDYGEIRSVTFSTNTTINVYVSPGNTIPTSGGISAVHYSSQSNPYNFSGGTSILGSSEIRSTFTSNSTSATQILGLSVPIYVPTGSREIEITLNARDVFRVGGSITDITIWTGAAAGTLTTQLAGGEPNVSSGNAAPLMIVWHGVLPSGLTYINAALASVATANSSLEATAVAPAQLNVKLLN